MTSNHPATVLNVEENSNPSIPFYPVNSSSMYRSKTRIKPEQMPISDLSQLVYLIRGCGLGESNKYLDTLLVWLSDPRTASHFHLKQLPGLLNAILEQYLGSFLNECGLRKRVVICLYLACLYELFGSKLFEESPINDLYIDWFLQIPFQVHPYATGPMSNTDRLESLFFGTHRYVLKQMLTKKDENLHCDESRHHSVMIRCSTLATIIRNLSFIEENLCLAHEYRLLDIFERILKYQHDLLHERYSYLPNDYLCTQCAGTADMDDRSNDTLPCWTSVAAAVKRSQLILYRKYPFVSINFRNQRRKKILLHITMIVNNINGFVFWIIRSSLSQIFPIQSNFNIVHN